MASRSSPSERREGGGAPKRRGADSFRVDEATDLLTFLRAHLPEEGRNSIKSLLSHRRILVNGKVTTRFNLPLSSGDRVKIARGTAPVAEASDPSGSAPHPQLAGLRILFEDEHLIVVDKEAGLLSIATAKERGKTAYRLLSDYVRQTSPNRRLFIVHRLDRESSGVMVFAKSPEAKQGLQAAWRDVVEKRSYSVVIEGVLSNASGSVVSWLREDRALIMRSSPVDNGGKRAVTNYRVLSRGAGHTLLDVELETGRKNQIRAQFQSIGHSVVGDAKYGASDNPLGRLALHARALSFRHPVTGRSMSFESPVPKIFYRLVARR